MSATMVPYDTSKGSPCGHERHDSASIGPGHNNPPAVDPEISPARPLGASSPTRARRVPRLGEIATPIRPVAWRPPGRARRVYKQVDTARKDAKQPHYGRGSCRRKRPSSRPADDREHDRQLKPMQTDWLRREEARIAAERQRRSSSVARPRTRRSAPPRGRGPERCRRDHGGRNGGQGRLPRRRRRA